MRIIVALLALGVSVAGAAEYFVAPDGHDDRAGTQAEPLATLQQAQRAVQPGDTVLIRGGSDWLNNSACRNWINFNLLNRLPDNATDVPGFGHRLKNNLGHRGRQELAHLDRAKPDATHNSFDLPVPPTDADFLSLDESALTAPRAADGALPSVTFMRLALGSHLRDGGVDAGLTLHGKSPWLGAFAPENIDPSHRK